MKKYCFLLVAFFICFHSKLAAQLSVPHQFSSVGFPETSPVSFAGSFVFDGTVCFQIADGIKKLLGTNAGFYKTDCDLSQSEKEDCFELTAFPNPVSSNLLISAANLSNLKLIGNIVVVLQLFDISGKPIKEFTTDLNTLNAGYKINMSSFIPGTYTLKVISGNNLTQTLKIIKLN